MFEGDESKAFRGPVRSPNYLRVADPSVSPKLLLQVHFTRVITERKYEVGKTTLDCQLPSERWERSPPGHAHLIPNTPSTLDGGGSSLVVRFLGDRDSESECRPPTGEREPFGGRGGGEGDEDGLLHLLLFRASFLSPDALLDRQRTLLECGGERERELLLVRLDAVSIFKTQDAKFSIFQI